MLFPIGCKINVLAQMRQVLEKIFCHFFEFFFPFVSLFCRNVRYFPVRVSCLSKSSYVGIGIFVGCIGLENLEEKMYGCGRGF